MTRTLVIGGGVTGLAAAWRLHSAGHDVHLYEASRELGGAMKTREVEGFIFEDGPNTVRGNSEALTTWLAELGLNHAVLKSRKSANRRFIWRKRRLHEVPTGPLSFLTSGLLSFRAKLRVRAEKKKPVPFHATNETLRQFFDRRIGAEATSAFVDPFVAGVFAGDVDELGTDAFPMLRDMEKTHGSLLKALRARKSAGGGLADLALIGLEGGWQRLPDAVGQALGPRLHLEHRLDELWSREGRFTAVLNGPNGKEEVTAESVILALPAFEAGRVLSSVSPEVAEALEAIPHPHVAVVGLGYSRQAIGHPLDGFGLLVPSDQPIPGAPSVLGILFPSSIFDGRAPDGCVSLLVMLGGSRDKDSANMSDAGIAEQAIAAAGKVLGSSGRPDVVSVVRHRRAIPQYLPGHSARITGVREELASHPGLILAGNYLSGVSVEASVASGFSAASQILAES